MQKVQTKQKFVLFFYILDIASFNAKEDDHGLSNVSHVIENLQSGLMYNFSVAAKNSKGEGPMSPNSVAFTTGKFVHLLSAGYWIYMY